VEEQVQNIISAEELFGAENQLVEQVEGGALSGVASLGLAYQGVAAAIALLFIFILARNIAPFLHLVTTAFGKQHNNSDAPLFAAEISNIKLFTSLVGSLLLSLLVMRLSVEPWAAPAFASFAHLSVWEIGGVSLAAILATFVVERILLYIVGFMSERTDICNMIWQTKHLYFSLVILLLLPMLILMLLTEGTAARIALYASILVCSLSLILFIKETFLLFRTERFSIFHWFLYLCALEFFPLSLLLAPIARG
jgi:hypothetical protein